MMTAMRAFLTCPGPLIPVPDSHSISIVHGPTSFAYTDTVLKERRRKRLSQPHQDTPLTDVVSRPRNCQLTRDEELLLAEHALDI